MTTPTECACGAPSYCRGMCRPCYDRQYFGGVTAENAEACRVSGCGNHRAVNHRRGSYRGKYCSKHNARSRRGQPLDAENVRGPHYKRNSKNRLIRYGLSELDYATMLVNQGGTCAICGGTQEISLAIDHDHSCCPKGESCGKCVRGLLCSPCNIGLGNFTDSIEKLEGAIDYLKRWSSDDAD